ncbi:MULTISPECIES: alkaline phosphatase family protein [Sphingobacterium]|uniref:alkaline phosphatase family protein n=1 Tax=Sphingobacterium TaxID=28453 RepID=UPI000B943696|nr:MULTISPECIES: alkaline phosphatase family protein [Sphingobacterium]OYD47530.1 hypothetical protein CHU00_01245 [Sphingobacterium cellulitidis]WFB62519.1 DUF4983 domain-containing protein [Sphingobacterium sp. WM]
MKKRILNSISAFMLMILGLTTITSCQEEFSKVIPENNNDSIDVIYGTPKVLLLIVDGARGESVRTSNIPNINALIPHSIYSWVSLSEENAAGIYSNWSNLFTGVNFSKHGVRDNTIENNKFDAYPLLAQRIKDATNDSIKMSTISSNATFLKYFGANTKALTAQNDDDVTTKVINDLKDEKLSLITGHFSAVDAAGKSAGYDVSKPAYKAAIEKFDAQVGQMIKALEARPSYAKENWMVVITSSQGGEYEIPPAQNDNTIFSNAAVNTFTVIYSPKFSTKFVGKPFIGNKFIGDFMRFNAENYAQLDSGDNSIFNLDNKDFTIELKIKKNKGRDNNYAFWYPSIIGKRKHWQGGWGEDPTGIGWVIHLSGESWIFNARGDKGTGEVKADKNLNRGTWNSIAVTGQTVDGKRTVRLYTNGELSKEAEITGWGSITSEAKLRIGFLETREGWRSDAYLADVKIWKEALSPQTIKQYSCEVGVESNHPNINFLAGYWPMNSTDGSVLLDEGPFGSHMKTHGNYPITNLNDFICAPSAETLSALVPRNIDVATQIISWLKVPRQLSWGLDGRVWIDK